MNNVDEITIDEAIEEIDKMIVGYQYHMYDEDGKIEPAYSYLIKPCNALIMAIKVLEKEKERYLDAYKKFENRCIKPDYDYFI